MLTEDELVHFITGQEPGGPGIAAEADWPADWSALLDRMLLLSTGRPWREHAPGLTGATVEQVGEVLRIDGQVGPLRVQVLARLSERGLALDLEWQNATAEPVTDLAVGLRLPGPDQARGIVPRAISHDDPSADPDRTVPHVSRGGFVTELHRLPVPAVCLQDVDGGTLTLVALPEADEDSGGRVRYGSLGARTSAASGETWALALSGVTLFDGEPDITYVHKAKTAPTSAGYRDLLPGDSLRQRFVIDRGWAEPGHGFRQLVRIGRKLFGGGEQVRPGPLPDEEHIQLRLAALDARAFTDGEVAGYAKFPSWGEPRKRAGRPEMDFLYGWTGQCLRLAWCEAWVGLEHGEPHRLERARAVTEFYLQGSATGTPGLRYNSYIHDDRRWQGLRRRGVPVVSARAYGETLCALADLVTLLRRHQEPVPDAWTAALQEAAEHIAAATLPSGLVPVGWTADGQPVEDAPWSAGIPSVRAVARTAQVTGRRDLLSRAEDLAELYHELHARTFDRPFAHSTLDAACEDKEGGLGYFELLMTLQEATGRAVYTERAQVVAEWLLSWVYHWNPQHDRGAPLREAGFDATGWPGVSVQNHHLDVFFPTFDLWRLAHLTGDEWLHGGPRPILTAASRGVCTAPGEWGFEVVGEQGEAFFVTSWQDRGHSNTWNPSWVIALPLAQLLRFTAADAHGIDYLLDDVRFGDLAEGAVVQP